MGDERWTIGDALRSFFRTWGALLVLQWKRLLAAVCVLVLLTCQPTKDAVRAYGGYWAALMAQLSTAVFWKRTTVIAFALCGFFAVIAVVFYYLALFLHSLPPRNRSGQ